MKLLHDEDEYETVVTSRQCTSCAGDPKRCDGGCNGSFGVSQRRRDPAEIRKIKAERQRKREDGILAEADAIRLRRSL